MKQKNVRLAAFYLAAWAAMNGFKNTMFNKIESSPKRSIYNLPQFKVGKHLFYAKNEKDALKYAKKRGMWDGVSQPIRVM